jgi:hypothetical protein
MGIGSYLANKHFGSPRYIGSDVRFLMMIVCGIKLFNIILFLSPEPFIPSSPVEPINNKSLYLFTARRALVQGDIPFSKPFNILSHLRLLSFAQYVIEDDLRTSIVFHLLNFF